MKSRQFVVAFDVDGVCADLMSEWLSRYNVVANDTLRPEHITDWDVTKFVRPDYRTYIHEILHHRDLYDQVEPINGALETVRFVRALGARVVFATSAMIGHAGQKLVWLRRHGFLSCKGMSPCLDYLELHDKLLLNADLLIDDREATVRAFWGADRRALLFPSPATAHLGNARPTWEDVRVWVANELMIHRLKTRHL